MISNTHQSIECHSGRMTANVFKLLQLLNCSLDRLKKYQRFGEQDYDFQNIKLGVSLLLSRMCYRVIKSTTLIQFMYVHRIVERSTKDLGRKSEAFRIHTFESPCF